MIPVHYHEAAEEGLLTEIVYLESRAAGLGRRFFADIRKAEGLRPPYWIDRVSPRS